MAKTKVSEFDATASNNTDINSVNVAEGCPPSGINNAIREMASLLKKQEVGTDAMTSPDIDGGTIDGATIGASSASTGAFTNLSVSGAFTSQGIDDNADATAITIDSSERVGIGTSPSQLLDVVGGSANIRVAESSGGDLRMNVSGSTGGIGTHSNHPLLFRTNSTERMRIDSSGNVGIGTSSPNEKFTVSSGNTTTAISIINSKTTTLGTETNFLSFFGTSNGGSVFSVPLAQIGAISANGSAQLGSLVFHTSAFNSASTEHMRILSNGALQVKVGSSVYDTWSNNSDACQINTNIIDKVPFTVNAANSAFGNDVQRLLCDRGATSNFDFLVTTSGDLADDQHKLRGDGNAYADGSWNGGGADYAEYFEWKDGNTNNEDRRGYTVVLDGHQIRKSTSDDNSSTIIGAISGNPSVVGDNAWNSWSNKYQKDDYGSYVLDSDGDRILNSSYDETKEYVTREDRQEWGIVGLMGKLRIRVGQTVGSNWIKMREISDTVHEYLVR